MGPSSMVGAMSTALYLDTVAAEVAAVFDSQGIRSLLLKGPVMQANFYGPTEFRPYGDVDLLVQGQDLERATSLLTALGFSERLARADNVDPLVVSSAWERAHPGPAIVDLHNSFHGVGSPTGLWHALTKDEQEFVVAGSRLKAPSTVGAALIAVLHAATALAGHQRPIDDLRRAVGTLTEEEWREVGERLRLAAALPLALATLNELGHGKVAESIASERIPTAELLAVRGVGGSQRLLSLFRSASWPQRIRLVGRTVWPSTAYMRWLAQDAGRQPHWIPIERLRRTWQMLRNAVKLARAAVSIRRAHRRHPKLSRDDQMVFVGTSQD